MQRSLRVPKGKPRQSRWMVLACADKSFALSALIWGDGDVTATQTIAYDRPYSDLWRVLRDAPLDAGKYWLVGWRVRYALDRADFLGALERGEVRLPVACKGKNAGKHTGRVSMSSRILEVDIECGTHSIKLLDWGNYGVMHAPYADAQDSVVLSIAVTALRDYLLAAHAAGIRVNRTTAAQLGWAHARSGYLAGELFVNADPEARRLERLAYHGGRCEAFRLGEIPGTTYSLDVRACYATICLDERLPCQQLEEYRAGCAAEQIDTAGPDHWIADVIVQTDEADYPLRWHGSPIFPVGQFRTALPWPELRHALLRCRVVKVLRAARYRAGPVLRPYAKWYLAERAKQLPLRAPKSDMWLKALFNASLGYTAREKYEWQPWEIEIPWDYWIGIARSPENPEEACQAQKLGDETRWLRVAGEPREAMPFLHATICSYARVKLLEIFEAAVRQNILYCDTDGILTTRAGLDRLTLTKEAVLNLPFGLVERFKAGAAFINGQKNYSVGESVIHAGAIFTRQDRTRCKQVLTTTTGRRDESGRVHPFTMRCDDGINEMA